MDIITSTFKQMRRKEAAFKSKGNTIKSRRQFWKYVGGKTKKGSGFTALRDPESGVVKCGVLDMVKITENHIKDIFSGDFCKSQLNNIQEEELELDIVVGASDHQYSFTKGSEDMWKSFGFDPGPRLLCSDMSESPESDPVGFCNKKIDLEEVQYQVKQLKNGKA